MKLRFSKRGIIIGIIFGLFATISLIIVIKYTDALFLVLMGWILIPVILAKLYYWLKEK